MENAEAPIDIDRLVRPDADAFRLIAAALGARFAGDPAPAIEVPPRAPFRSVALPVADSRAAALLDRVPVAAVVVDGDTIAFLNRAAQQSLGYPSAAVLDAAGGLGALFRGTEAATFEPGTMVIAAANGATFAARVTMSTVEWGGGRAMLVTLEPREASVARLGGTSAPLIHLLDANPDPVAIVNRGGGVEAYNTAFARVAPGERIVRLDGCLSAGDLDAVLGAVRHASCLEEGVAEPPAPVRLGGLLHRVTAGPLLGGHLACVVFHQTSAERTAAPALPPPLSRGALERAVADVRRLVDEAAVLVILDGAPRDDGGEAAVRFWRSLVLSVASRAEVGSVLTIRHEADTTLLHLAPRATAPVDRALASLRLADLAAAAALEIGLEGDALAVRPARESPGEIARLDTLR